jgi:hypothetical protein
LKIETTLALPHIRAIIDLRLSFLTSTATFGIDQIYGQWKKRENERGGREREKGELVDFTLAIFSFSLACAFPASLGPVQMIA